MPYQVKIYASHFHFSSSTFPTVSVSNLDFFFFSSIRPIILRMVREERGREKIGSGRNMGACVSNRCIHYSFRHTTNHISSMVYRYRKLRLGYAKLDSHPCQLRDYTIERRPNKANRLTYYPHL